MCGGCSCSRCKPAAAFAPYGYDDYCATPIWGCPEAYCQCTSIGCVGASPAASAPPPPLPAPTSLPPPSPPPSPSASPTPCASEGDEPMCGGCSCNRCKPTAAFAPYGYDAYCATPIWGCPAAYCQCTGTVCGTRVEATAASPGGGDLSSAQLGAGGRSVQPNPKETTSDALAQTHLTDSPSSADAVKAATTSRDAMLSITALAVCAAVGVVVGLCLLRRRAWLAADDGSKGAESSGLPEKVAPTVQTWMQTAGAV